MPQENESWKIWNGCETIDVPIVFKLLSILDFSSCWVALERKEVPWIQRELFVWLRFSYFRVRLDSPCSRRVDWDGLDEPESKHYQLSSEQWTPKDPALNLK